MSESKLGRAFARDVEAILSVLAMQNQDGQMYCYPWEVRQNLRLAGMSLDRQIPQFVMPDYDWEHHEPDFDPEPEGDLNDEEETD